MATNGLTLDDSVHERLLRERVIFLGSQVDDDIANRLCSQLLLLAAEDDEQDISFYINSPGGSVDAGMAIYDTMNYIGCDVATFGMGMAGSMGQFLLTCGTPGKRHALAHTRIIMHQPSAGLGGSAADIQILAEQHAHMKRQLGELLAQHTGQSYEQILLDWDRDRWFTAAEARDYGMIDHIISGPPSRAIPVT
ncbi:ATP-dependent Clp protease protease subunit [Nocardia tenerifensis]|uniref:ATP-dependent Clp protease proteolytic subunit n=1 Tax=Nocardia tenerifensis TaxID=228006 RepID=A0A318KD10_9NOCA|nr:ATP-dependent Clp protease proteolytic subunit [Nocardia tenerifensis]PXX68949.1 ATP-dependent Clp protease protease subunit [Nocardia tenerifensis]